MPDLFPITIPDEIAELNREIELRERIYPKMVRLTLLTSTQAARQIAVMRSAVESLQRLAGFER